MNKNYEDTFEEALEWLVRSLAQGQDTPVRPSVLFEAAEWVHRNFMDLNGAFARTTHVNRTNCVIVVIMDEDGHTLAVGSFSG